MALTGGCGGSKLGYHPEPHRPRKGATASIEHETEVLSERFDGLRVVSVGISVRTPDDHGTEGSLVVPRGWEHRRDEGIPLAITQ